jgi:uncharacterized MAPEG superfamily protein
MDLNDPLMATYCVAAGLMILKMMGQGWMTVARMMKAEGGFVNPEDQTKGWTNPNPKAGQIEPNEYVERSRRMHHNDVENIPAFLIAGLMFVLTDPPLWLAALLLYGYVLSRAAHFWAYLSAKPHETRATFWTIGSFIVIAMAGTSVAMAIGHLI